MDNTEKFDSEVMKYDPSVFVVGRDYQIIFLTETPGIGWIEIDGERYTDEEGGLLQWSRVHKIAVDGEALNRAQGYTLVFVEYPDKLPYYPVGEEKIRKFYPFKPADGDNIKIFQFADTHAAVDLPMKTYDEYGGCDLLVLNGDINEHSYEIDNFRTAFELSSRAVHGSRPVVYSRGNHDTRGKAAQILPDYIPTDFRHGRRETFYSFRQGSLWGLVLDCGEDKYDHNVEYGGTILFNTFRNRETAYLKSLIANKENEYAAEGVRYRLAICHVPIVEHFEHPFDVASDIYAEWTELLGEMGIELLLCGHMHRAYFIPSRDSRYNNAEFPTAVLSIPRIRDGEGAEHYVGGVVEFTPEGGRAEIVPNINCDKSVLYFGK